MESITVQYSRKVSPGNFESIGIGGSIEFKPTTEDLQAEYEGTFAALKLIVDAKIAEAIGNSGGTFDEPDLGPAPDWVGQHPERTAALLAGSSAAAPPPPPPPPAPTPKPVVATAPDQDDDEGLPEIGSQQGPSHNVAPRIDGNPEGRDVYLERAKVFRSEMKRSKTNKVYGELRVGHNDLTAHIGEQYVTVRVFDPQYAAVIGSLSRENVQKLNIVEKDFVNLWGTFSPWTSNPEKFDLNATAVQKA